jgi:hypothetical protein
LFLPVSLPEFSGPLRQKLIQQPVELNRVFQITEMADIVDHVIFGARDVGGDLARHIRRGQRIELAADDQRRHVDFRQHVLAVELRRRLDRLDIGMLVQPRRRGDGPGPRIFRYIGSGQSADGAGRQIRRFQPVLDQRLAARGNKCLLFLGREMSETGMHAGQGQGRKPVWVVGKEFERYPPTHRRADDMRFINREDINHAGQVVRDIGKAERAVIIVGIAIAAYIPGHRAIARLGESRELMCPGRSVSTDPVEKNHQRAVADIIDGDMRAGPGLRADPHGLRTISIRGDIRSDIGGKRGRIHRPRSRKHGTRSSPP